MQLWPECFGCHGYGYDRTIICIRNLDTNRERDGKQFNIFERRVFTRILGPVNGNKKENWRIVTNKEMYAIVKKPNITEKVRLHKLL
jgi:hypothetical protein